MSDKVQLIKQEIERLKHTSNAYDRSRFMLLLEIEEFINSLQEEPASEDLEEEIEKKWTNCATWVSSVSGESSLLEKSGYYELNLSKSDFKDIAHHFAEWQKKQMMKDAVECRVQCGWGDGNKLSIKAMLPQDSDLKYADKAKVLILKTE